MYNTDPNKYPEIAKLVVEMGLFYPRISWMFINYMVICAANYEGVFDMMHLWRDAHTLEDKLLILEDIQAAIVDAMPHFDSWSKNIDWTALSLVFGRVRYVTDLPLSKYDYLNSTVKEISSNNIRIFI